MYVKYIAACYHYYFVCKSVQLNSAFFLLKWNSSQSCQLGLSLQFLLWWMSLVPTPHHSQLAYRINLTVAHFPVQYTSVHSPIYSFIKDLLYVRHLEKAQGYTGEPSR